MENITVRPVSEKASRLLQDLIDLELLEIVPGDRFHERTALADKLWGIIPPEFRDSLSKHVDEIRNEWECDI